MVQIRPDQRASLLTVSQALGVSMSDLARWFIDEGVKAVEAAPTYETLKEALHG